MKSLLSLMITLLTFQAHAIDLNQFNGTWKEIGYRCVGDKAFKPRPWSSEKFFTIENFDYTHRVELSEQFKCPLVESSGTITTAYYPGSRWLEILVRPTSSKTCGNLVDDFSQGAQLWLTLEDIGGQTYMIIAGDPVYVDPMCSHPIVERVYSLQ